MEIMAMPPKAVMSNRERTLRAHLRWARAAYYSAVGITIMDLGWLLQGNLFGLVAIAIWGLITIAKHSQMKAAERTLEDFLLDTYGPAAIVRKR